MFLFKIKIDGFHLMYFGTLQWSIHSCVNIRPTVERGMIHCAVFKLLNLIEDCDRANLGCSPINRVVLHMIFRYG